MVSGLLTTAEAEGISVVIVGIVGCITGGEYHRSTGRIPTCKIILDIMGVESEVQQKVARMAVSDDGNQTKGFADIVAEKKHYYEKRVQLFEQYIARDKAAIEAAKQASVPIKVVLPDGATKAGVRGVTTPLDIASDISKSLAKKVVVAKVDGEVWDLFRPLEGDCSLSLHSFDDPEGKEVRQGSTQGDPLVMLRSS